ncbi:hypothetical protein V6N13_126003 [Hibiscus sabdariffa]
MEKRERHDEGKEREHGVQRVVSLFVENIPEAMQWKVLWHSKRHGEVVDVYITILRGSGVELAWNNQQHRGRFVGRNGERVEEFNSK